MPRTFLILETTVRRFRVTLSDDQAKAADERGGQAEVEMCAMDQASAPSPELGDVVVFDSIVAQATAKEIS